MDNKVILKVDKPVKVEHVDMIIMFLENQKLSGGGNIFHYELNESKETLIVYYEKTETMQRVMNKKTLQFHVYKFLLVDSSDANSDYFDKIDSYSLVLKNVPEIEDYVVKMYAESLAIEENSTNKIESYKRSHYFKNICYIKFKDKINFDYCNERLNRRPTLNERKIEIDQMMFTNTIFFEFDPVLRSPMTLNHIEEFFQNKKNFNENPILSIKTKDSFVFMKFDSTKNQLAFNNKKIKELFGNSTVIENLSNEKLFDEQIDQLNNDSASRLLGNSASSISTETIQSDNQSDLIHEHFRGIRSPNENIVRRKYLRIKKLITKK